MTRSKINLAYIANDSQRKASFKKRKDGLIKKANELSTLCGVDTCAIIYSPYEDKPVVFPSRPGALSVLERLQSLSQMDQTRKKFNQEDFTHDRIKKLAEKHRILMKENNHKEMEIFMYQCIVGMKSVKEFNLHNTAQMNYAFDQTLSDINYRLEAKEIANRSSHVAPNSTSAAVGFGASAMVVMTRAANENMESFPWHVVESLTSVDPNEVVKNPNAFNSLS